MATRSGYLLSAVIALAFTAALAAAPALAQTPALPGVRGALYESPSYGWILLVPQPDWTFADAQSAQGTDTVHLVSSIGDGADEYFVSFQDDGRGSEGCVHDIVDTLARSYGRVPLQGWNDPQVEYMPNEPEGYTARARIPDPNDANLDILAYIQCDAGRDQILVGSVLLRSARDLQEMVDLPLLSPLLPGEGHTGRPRPNGGPAPGEGVLRFLYRGVPAGAESQMPFPFSCIHQESFARPADPPPAETGYFACDGQIANVDTVPATIDLNDIALACLNAPTETDGSPVCPNAPVRPVQFELLQAPAGESGATITLQPGESAEVVLWYALPAGEPPTDIVDLEPDRQVRVGPTFFSAGTGSRPLVRLGR